MGGKTADKPLKESGEPSKPKKPKANQPPKEITESTPEELAIEEEGKRLRKRAQQIGLICKKQDSSKTTLRPSSTIKKLCRNRPVEIVKKALVRKNKALLLFPGLVSLVKEGKLGQLSNMQKNPTLDVEFSTGILRLKGTRMNSKQKFLSVVPKARKLILQDVFEHLVVFVEHEWLGPEADNPMLGGQSPSEQVLFEGGASEVSHGQSNVNLKLSKASESVSGSKDHAIPEDLLVGEVGRARRSLTAKPLQYKECNSDDEGSDSDVSLESESDDNNEDGTRSPVQNLPSAPFTISGLARTGAASSRGSAASAASSKFQKEGSDNSDSSERDVKVVKSSCAGDGKGGVARPSGSVRPDIAKNVVGPAGGGGQKSILAFIRPVKNHNVVSLDSDEEPVVVTKGGDARKSNTGGSGAVSSRRVSQVKSYRVAGTDDEDEDDDEECKPRQPAKASARTPKPLRMAEPAKSEAGGSGRRTSQVKSYRVTSNSEEEVEVGDQDNESASDAPARKRSAKLLASPKPRKNTELAKSASQSASLTKRKKQLTSEISAGTPAPLAGTRKKRKKISSESEGEEISESSEGEGHSGGDAVKPKSRGSGNTQRAKKSLTKTMLTAGKGGAGNSKGRKRVDSDSEQESEARSDDDDDDDWKA